MAKKDSLKIDVAVVIPVYNEEEIIAKVLGEWHSELTALGINFMIHAYNDGSRDSSLKVLRRYGRGKKHVIVHDKPNSGHGPTILKGYRDNLSAEWIFQVDSDNEMSAASFKELWERREEFDFLIGRRDGRSSPLSRRLISFISRVTVRLFYGGGVFDVNSPYRLMRVSAFRDSVRSIPAGTFAPNVVMSGAACLKGMRIFETDVKYNFRETGTVSIKKLKLLKAAMKSFAQTVACRFALK